MSANRSGTKAERFLRWLKRHPEGKTFTECQRYVVERIRGQDYDERKDKIVHDPYVGPLVVGKGLRKHRGAWCDHLLGHGNGRPGLLQKYCTSEVGADGKKRYRVVAAIKPPFYGEDPELKMRRHMHINHHDGSACSRYPNYKQSQLTA